MSKFIYYPKNYIFIEFNLNFLTIYRGRTLRSKKHLVILQIILLLSLLSPFIQGQEITPVMLSNIELVTVDETTAVVTWVTNLPADTAVEWGTTEDLGSENYIDESENYHLGRLTDLSEGTSYYYRVGSDGRWSEISSFTTLIAPDVNFKLKFAVVADTHYDLDGQTSPNGMMYEDSVQLVKSMVEELNSDSSLSFVIVNGDMTNKGTEDDFIGFASEMDKLNIPWYPVLGNHDKTFEDWQTWYENSMGRTESYYAFSSAGYRLIIMDSAVVDQVQGDLDEIQLAWLQGELDEYAEIPTLIFMHHMADRTDINGITEEAKNNLDSILEGRSNVLCITSGHVHQNIVEPSDGDYIYVSVAAVVSYPIGFSKIQLYETGYTQAFYKIESELETSEKSRLKMVSTSGPNSDDEALGELEDRSIIIKVPQKPNPPPNQPPIISTVSTDLNPILPGGTTTISVVAIDPEGEELSYIYETDGGTIDGIGETVIYHAPQEPGTYTINVKVSDGELFSQEKSIEIEVLLPFTNHAPVIEKIQKTTTEVHPDNYVEIEVIASDEDGDSLTYYYEASAGTIIGTGNKVSWQAPDYTGVFSIKVWVSDGSRNSEVEKISIDVVEAPKSSGDQGLPGFEGILIILALISMLLGHYSIKRAIGKINELKIPQFFVFIFS